MTKTTAETPLTRVGRATVQPAANAVPIYPDAAPDLSRVRIPISTRKMNEMSEVMEPSSALATDETTGTALAVIPATAISTIIAADKDDILGKLRAELAGYTPDASTEAGRKEIGQKTRRIGMAKMDFKRLKDGLLEGAKKQVTSVNAEYKVIETNCDTLRDAIDGVLEAYKQIERDRVAGHEAALSEIERWAVFPGEWSSSMIADHYMACKEHPHQTRIWQEFTQKARYTIDGSMNALDRIFGAKLKEETEAAELAELRAAEAERAHLAAIEAQRVREQQIAAAAAEAARLEAEAKAARDAEEAERRVQAEREREVARQVAERADTARVEAHQAALERMRKLATPLTPPDSVPVIDAKIAQLVEAYDRPWGEFDVEAAQTFAASGAALRDARGESVRIAEMNNSNKETDNA